MSEAHKTSDLAASRGLDHFSLGCARYELAFVEGDTKGMAEQVAWFDGKPPNIQHYMLWLEAGTEAYRGHVRVARECTHRAADAVAQRGNTEAAASYHLDAGWREAVFGKTVDSCREATAVDSSDADLVAGRSVAVEPKQRVRRG